MDVTAPGPASGITAAHLARSLEGVRTAVMQKAAEHLGISVDRLRAEVAAGAPLSDLTALATTSVSSTPPPSDGEAHQVDVHL